MLGNGYPMNEWHTAVYKDVPYSSTIELKDSKEGWEGSCYGLAALQILLESGILSPQDFGAEEIAAIQPTENTVSFINCLHQTSSLPFMIGQHTDQVGDTQQQILARIICYASGVNNGEAPFMLTIRTSGGGLHALAGYGLENGAWEWDGNNYDRRIWLWDSNYTDGSDQAQLYYNSKTLHFTIPAYNIQFNNSESDVGELQYAVNHFPSLYKYYADRVNPLPGDINADTELSISDAVCLMKMIAEEPDSAPIKGTMWYNADINGDNYIDSLDLVGILHRLEG